MKSRRLVAASTGLALLGLTIGVGAGPAAAAELPDSDALYAVATDEGIFQLWQLLEVDSTTAETTLVGESTTAPEDERQYQGAYDPATDTAYFIGLTGGGSFLMTVDLQTGEWADVGPIIENPADPEFLDVTALAIGPASAALVITEGQGLYSLDLATGEATYIANFSPHLHSFAYDAVTDGYYGITASGNIVEIDITDGSDTVAGTVTFPDPQFYYPYSLQFDSAGALWVLVNGDWGDSDALYSFTFADTTLVLSGELSFEGTKFLSFSLLLAPAQEAPVPPPTPGLADTGVEMNLSLGVAALLIAFGVAMLFVTRRLRVA